MTQESNGLRVADAYISLILDRAPFDQALDEIAPDGKLPLALDIEGFRAQIDEVKALIDSLSDKCINICCEGGCEGCGGKGDEPDLGDDDRGRPPPPPKPPRTPRAPKAIEEPLAFGMYDENQESEFPVERLDEWNRLSGQASQIPGYGYVAPYDIDQINRETGRAGEYANGSNGIEAPFFADYGASQATEISDAEYFALAGGASQATEIGEEEYAALVGGYDRQANEISEEEYQALTGGADTQQGNYANGAAGIAGMAAMGGMAALGMGESSALGLAEGLSLADPVAEAAAMSSPEMVTAAAEAAAAADPLGAEISGAASAAGETGLAGIMLASMSGEVAASEIAALSAGAGEVALGGEAALGMGGEAAASVESLIGEMTASPLAVAETGLTAAEAAISEVTGEAAAFTESATAAAAVEEAAAEFASTAAEVSEAGMVGAGETAGELFETASTSFAESTAADFASSTAGAAEGLGADLAGVGEAATNPGMWQLAEGGGEAFTGWDLGSIPESVGTASFETGAMGMAESGIAGATVAEAGVAETVGAASLAEDVGATEAAGLDFLSTARGAASEGFGALESAAAEGTGAVAEGASSASWWASAEAASGDAIGTALAVPAEVAVGAEAGAAVANYGAMAPTLAEQAAIEMDLAWAGLPTGGEGIAEGINNLGVAGSSAADSMVATDMFADEIAIAQSKVANIAAAEAAAAPGESLAASWARMSGAAAEAGGAAEAAGVGIAEIGGGGAAAEAGIATDWPGGSWLMPGEAAAGGAAEAAGAASWLLPGEAAAVGGAEAAGVGVAEALGMGAAGAAEAAGVGIGEGILGGLVTVLEILSPSRRVAREVGQPILEALDQTMSQGTASLTETYTNSLMSTFNDSLGNFWKSGNWQTGVDNLIAGGKDAFDTISTVAGIEWQQLGPETASWDDMARGVQGMLSTGVRNFEQGLLDGIGSLVPFGLGKPLATGIGQFLGTKPVMSASDVNNPGVTADQGGFADGYGGGAAFNVTVNNAFHAPAGLTQAEASVQQGLTMTARRLGIY